MWNIPRKKKIYCSNKDVVALSVPNMRINNTSNAFLADESHTVDVDLSASKQNAS